MLDGTHLQHDESDVQAKELKSKYTGVSSDMMRNRSGGGGGSSGGVQTGLHLFCSCKAALRSTHALPHAASAAVAPDQPLTLMHCQTCPAQMRQDASTTMTRTTMMCMPHVSHATAAAQRATAAPSASPAAPTPTPWRPPG